MQQVPLEGLTREICVKSMLTMGLSHSHLAMIKGKKVVLISMGVLIIVFCGTTSKEKSNDFKFLKDVERVGKTEKVEKTTVKVNESEKV